MKKLQLGHIVLGSFLSVLVSTSINCRKEIVTIEQGIDPGKISLIPGSLCIATEERLTNLSETDQSCMAQVCEYDAVCCDIGWDLICVDEVASYCEAKNCLLENPDLIERCAAHDIDEIGEPLTHSCNACTASICGWFDPFCCDTAWDSQCIMEALERPECASFIHETPSSCAHSPCITGGALNPVCSACAYDVCETNSLCCMADPHAYPPSSEWNHICVLLATMKCGTTCNQQNCTHPLCETGEKLAPDCDGCVAQVYSQHPSCCTVEWNEECISYVKKYCAVGTCPSTTESGSSSSTGVGGSNGSGGNAGSAGSDNQGGGSSTTTGVGGLGGAGGGPGGSDMGGGNP